VKDHPIQFYWQKAGFKPNESQREAVLHVNGPIFITAGPGSGKTRVLLWRTLNLIVFNGVKTEEIFLSTFTEKAAKQLHNGLRNLLGLVTNETGRPFDLSRMAIGTVHSLCRILLVDRRFDPEHTRRRAPVLLDELGQYFRVYNHAYWRELIAAGGFEDEEAAQRAINQHLIDKDIYSRHEAVKNCLAAFNRFSEEDLDPGRVTTEEPILRALLEMYAKYKSDLGAANGVSLVDFALLQQNAYKYFQANEAACRVFSHVIVDEYQDTNAIQEKIFFRLAGGHGNLCVVGDDDQALYRFRGATVENLVQFERRCEANLDAHPRRVDLSVNYRSRPAIVDFCGDFISRINWEDPMKLGLFHRIHDKRFIAHRTGREPAVIVSARNKADLVYEEIAGFIKTIKEKGIIRDYNQAAFLFPSMKSLDGMNTRVHGFISAFEKLGIPYYAPRAGRFLEVDEAMVTFGIFQRVFGAPPLRARTDASRGIRDFQNWLATSRARADEICEEDPGLAGFLKDREGEATTAGDDYALLLEGSREQGLEPRSPVEPGYTRILARLSGISLRTQKALQSHRVNELIRMRHDAGTHVSLAYLLNRATALDWSVLDLFYQINGYEHYRAAYRDAEEGTDEGPICNLGLITQYLSRFMEEYSPILTGRVLSGGTFVNLFFSSYLYALFRLGESEYEDAEDPFPKGRVPFLTIHQSKGLEFPVVVLGSVYRNEHEAQRIETAVRSLLGKEGEPLEKIPKYDSMRLFYVGLSRAQNLLVLPRYTHAKAASPEFEDIYSEERLPLVRDLDTSSVPQAVPAAAELGDTYSFTGDYLLYRRCPRNYMIYRQYGFVPSRGQTMFFGRLIHETIEDIHNLVLARKEAGDA
jgi:DNA helicase-2/ATP-dependent DNA helicase PcrA